MLRGENVCDLSGEVQSVFSTQDAESEVRLDPIDQKMVNIQTRYSCKFASQLIVMQYIQSWKWNSLSGIGLTSPHLCNWKERGGRWETRHTCLCHRPTFTEIVFIMLWFPEEFCSCSFEFLHTAGALWVLRYLITSSEQLSGYSGELCPEIISTADWISP